MAPLSHPCTCDDIVIDRTLAVDASWPRCANASPCVSALDDGHGLVFGLRLLLFHGPSPCRDTPNKPGQRPKTKNRAASLSTVQRLRAFRRNDLVYTVPLASHASAASLKPLTRSCSAAQTTRSLCTRPAHKRTRLAGSSRVN